VRARPLLVFEMGGGYVPAYAGSVWCVSGRKSSHEYLSVEIGPETETEGFDLPGPRTDGFR